MGFRVRELLKHFSRKDKPAQLFLHYFNFYISKRVVESA